MAIVGGWIGPYQFHSLEGEITLNQETWQDISRPGEDGILALEMGNKGEPTTLVGTIDLLTPQEIQSVQLGYNQLKNAGDPVSIQVRYNTTFLLYNGFFIWNFRVIESWYSPTVTGGVNAGSYFLRTEWQVQYSLGV